MEEVFALAAEARGAVGHDTLSLCGADLAAEVGLAGLAELALFAFGGAGFVRYGWRAWGLNVLEGNDMVAGLYVGDALTDRLDVSGTLVTENDGEGTLGVLAGECVGICVADTGVVDLDTDFVGPGRKNLNLLDGEVFAGFPSNCSL